MRPRQLIAGAALLMLLLISLSGAVQAVTFTNSLGMTYTGPGPGAAPNACVDKVTKDFLSITNVGSDTLQGQFTVEFINPNGSRTTAGTFVVGTSSNPHVGDLNNFEIDYPPVSQWVVTDPSTGLKEIHVDITAKLRASTA